MTEPLTNKVGRMTPAGVFTEFGVPAVPNNHLIGITSGPDGNIWFTEDAGKVSKITPAGVITEFPVGLNEQPLEITPGPDGRLWFSDYTFGKVGAITTAGVVSLYTLPATSSFPTGISKGSDGNIWVCARGGNGHIDRITPVGVVTEFPIPGGEACDSLVLGPDGNVYFGPNGSTNGTHIGRVTPGGAFSFIQTGANGAVGSPNSLVVGKDGLIYFAIPGNPKTLGRITVGGTESEFSLGATNAWSLATGSDGFLYVADGAAHTIVKVSY